MQNTKNWEILQKLQNKNNKLQIKDILKLLLENRGLKTKKDIEIFLHPNLGKVTTKSVGIDPKQLSKAIKRIEKAIEKNEEIVVYGDYDVDGITASSILWETLYELGGNCLPYIPNRKDEGYGLSVKGINNLKEHISKFNNIALIITVDNGIVANEAVDFANKNNIDVIITDHHTISETIPNAHAIVHTTNLCGAGIAYLLSKELKVKNKKYNFDKDNHLELAALGTVADLVPLIGANRTIVFEGLKKIHNTKRVGLHALFQQASIDQQNVGVYEIGYIIGPRLNASGRIDSAMDSLRLLCTTNNKRARELAVKLEMINRERQQLLKEAAEHAINNINDQSSKVKRILIVGHQNYEEGVIGLIAGKLVETFYRPSIVLSLGEDVSKASVRSISGFNIIEFLRTHSEFFINVGGHPMAAGFTVETSKIDEMRVILENKAEELITKELLIRKLKIDFELPLYLLSQQVYDAIQSLAPFGMGNPEPVFVSRNVEVVNFRVLGKDNNHLKLVLKQHVSGNENLLNNKNSMNGFNNISHTEGIYEAIAFGMGKLADDIRSGDKIDIAYILSENTWNGETKLQLKIRDFK